MSNERHQHRPMFHYAPVGRERLEYARLQVAPLKQCQREVPGEADVGSNTPQISGGRVNQVGELRLLTALRSCSRIVLLRSHLSYGGGIPATVVAVR